MAHRSEPRLLVVHGLRLKGFAEPATVADLVGLDEATVRQHAEELVAGGHASYREGRLSGFLLTPAGRAEGERLLAEELDAIGGRDDVTEQYRTFLSFNQGLLEVCTSWQMREVGGEMTLNDHTDPAHDAAAVAGLTELHDKVTPIVAALRARLERFAGHGERLDHALAQVQAGEHEWFTKPMFPSYHSVWFELHEDLLATLGLDRAAEGST